MTTTQLHDYRISCDRHYSSFCRGAITITEAASQTEAEERAERLGWEFIIMAGCPPCEKAWVERQTPE